MKKRLHPLPETDFCFLEDMLDEEIKFLKGERNDLDNKDWHKLVDASIARCERLKKTLWDISEWNR